MEGSINTIIMILIDFITACFHCHLHLHYDRYAVATVLLVVIHIAIAIIITIAIIFVANCHGIIVLLFCQTHCPDFL